MYGLELFARGSKSLIESDSGAASIYFSEVYNQDDDERNWSLSYLKEQLMLKNCQELFRKYQVRVQHALFVELLVFNIVYNALCLIGYIFFTSKSKLEASDLAAGVIITAIWSRSLSFIIQFIIFIVAYFEKLFRSPCAKITTGCIVLFCMTLGEMATSFYWLLSEKPKPMMRNTYYILITTSVLLPFPRKLYCAISGAAVIMVDLMLSSLSNIDNTKKLEVVMPADVIFQVTVLAVGLSIRYIIEIMSRRAFLDRRECIESRIKGETEKYQEDKFLKTILPNHIAREVREDIWDVMKNMDKMHITHKPFNKLYVEKHKGVSVVSSSSESMKEIVETYKDLLKDNVRKWL